MANTEVVSPVETEAEADVNTSIDPNGLVELGAQVSKPESIQGPGQSDMVAKNRAEAISHLHAVANFALQRMEQFSSVQGDYALGRAKSKLAFVINQCNHEADQIGK
jgi:hypothetical protein